MVAVIEIFVYPQAWVEHLLWASVLVFLLTQGPGVFSVDYLVEGEGLMLDGVSVYGRKHMGALGLYAAALEPRIRAATPVAHAVDLESPVG